MRLGCCGSLDDAKMLRDAGFDFLEVNVQGVLRGDDSDAAYDATAPNPDKLALPVEAANCLVPGSRPIVGPSRDLAGLRDYMARVSKRGQRLGVKRFVFGSGGARKRPDGFPEAQAAEHLAEFTELAGEACAKHDIILVIEHLNRGETNTLNSLADCQALCEQVDEPSVQMLVDSYHYGLEKENDQAVLDLQGLLRHVHIAEVVDRIQPGGHSAASGKAFDFEDFFCLLRKIGYDERIALECKWTRPVPEIGEVTQRLVRESWNAAGRCECAGKV